MADAPVRLVRWLPFAIVLLSTSCANPLKEPEVEALVAKLDAIAVGADEAQVLRMLGPPTSSGPTFHLSQRAGYDRQFAEAASSGSVRYHFWVRGIDTTCAVGFDARSRVAYKACGWT